MSEKRKIKALVFDLGGVVVHGGYLDFVAQYVRPALVPHGTKKIAQLERQVDLGAITENEFYRDIEKTFHLHLKPSKMHKIIVDKMVLNKSLVSYISKIKKAKVALFSNSIGNMAAEVLRERRVPGKTFGKLFMSNKIHLAKPDQAAYRYVARHLKVKPQETLMIDDRPENVRDAKRIGMQGIVFRNTAQFKRAMRKFELA